ncbi:MAG: ABC transporter permease [Micrococcales bacterium]|nr:ABC transporter permease [Micrococcales bacterium]
MSTEVLDTAPAPETGKRLSREQVILLVGLPLAVAAIFAVWFIWWRTADLDDIEARALTGEAIRAMLWEHIKLTLVGTAIVVATAIPMGIALTRPGLRRLSPLVVGFANMGQSAPVIGLLVLFAMWLGFGFWVAVLGLCLYAFLPVLRNTIVGLQQVDPTLIEAARGMGMSPLAVLTKVELPLAVPVIMSGVRTALVLLVGTASLATFINAGGLGGLITTGINLFRFPILVSGALLIALLALLIDWAGRVLEAFTRPKGV